MTELHVSAWISALCLWPLGTLCAVALICKHYHDNWLQALGLIGLTLWAAGRASVLSERALDGGTVGAYQALSHVAMLLFALGTAIKVWRFRGEAPAPPLLHGRARPEPTAPGFADTQPMEPEAPYKLAAREHQP